MTGIKPETRLAVALTALTVIAVVGFQAWFMFENARGMADDAMISARFARNWASGAGLTYNRDGGQPVEGYSNFLWVAATAAGFRLGVHPRLTTAYLGGACSVLAALVAGLWVWRVTRRKLAAVATVAAVGLSLPFGLWAVQGLETPLIALLFVAVAASVDEGRPRPWPWAVALLAALTRPDGLLAVAALAVIEARRPKEQRRAAAISALWFLLPFAAYTLWRWSHFGALLPNTFGAKTGLGMAGVMVGLNYVREGFDRMWVIGLLVMAGIAGFIRNRRLGSVGCAALLFGSYLVFIIAVGGDFMPDHRFLMHLLPGIAGIGIAAAGTRKKTNTTKLMDWGDWFGALVIILLFSQSFVIIEKHDTDKIRWDWHHDQAEWYGPTASWLVRNTKRTDVIAAGDIGYIGYVTDNDRILDFNGLVDRHLASLPGAAAFETDPKYVFDQKPDYLVLMVHRFEDGRELGHSAFDRAALADPRLGSDYELRVELPGWEERVHSNREHDQKSDSRISFRIYCRK